MEVECRKLWGSGDFKTRADENGDMRISGYFAVFNTTYELWPGAWETVASGAFDGIEGTDVRCLVDHDTRLVLGRTTAGTLTLKQDEKGLWGEVLINPNDQDAVNLYERVKRGDVTQCSFGFDISDEDMEETKEGIYWTIKSVKLYEVSVVTFPAYEETEVTARKKDASALRSRKMEEWRSRILKKLKGE